MRKLLLIIFTLSQAVLFAQNPQQKAALNYLNGIRRNCGLVTLQWDERLARAAYYHSVYLSATKTQGHYQTVRNDWYFGTTPQERCIYMGYHTRMVGENVARAVVTYREAINNLMSAIYHRFIFLDFRFNQVGFAHFDTYYTFELGNRQADSLCAIATTEPPAGRYYYNVCDSPDKKIPFKTLEKALDSLRALSSKYILYPYDGQTQVPLFFKEETPDPLPQCTVTGFPISVQFNPYYVKNVTLIDFQLFENGIEIPGIIISRSNDVNKLFDSLQFAFFPTRMLKPATTYMAVFTYLDGPVRRQIKWHFTTWQPDVPLYFYKPGGEIHTNETIFYILLYPGDCHTAPENNSVRYKYEFRQMNAIFKNSYLLEVSIPPEPGKTAELSINGQEPMRIKYGE